MTAVLEIAAQSSASKHRFWRQIFVWVQFSTLLYPGFGQVFAECQFLHLQNRPIMVPVHIAVEEVKWSHWRSVRHSAGPDAAHTEGLLPWWLGWRWWCPQKVFAGISLARARTGFDWFFFWRVGMAGVGGVSLFQCLHHSKMRLKWKAKKSNTDTQNVAKFLVVLNSCQMHLDVCRPTVCWALFQVLGVQIGDYSFWTQNLGGERLRCPTLSRTVWWELQYQS